MHVCICVCAKSADIGIALMNCFGWWADERWNHCAKFGLENLAERRFNWRQANKMTIRSNLGNQLRFGIKSICKRIKFPANSRPTHTHTCRQIVHELHTGYLIMGKTVTTEIIITNTLFILPHLIYKQWKMPHFFSLWLMMAMQKLMKTPCKNKTTRYAIKFEVTFSLFDCLINFKS